MNSYTIGIEEEYQVAVAEGVLSDETEKRLTSGLEQEVLRVNEWRAAHEGLGDRDELAHVSTILSPGTATDRMRALFAQRVHAV